MERKKKDAWVSAAVASMFVLAVTFYAQSTFGMDAVEAPGGTDPFTAFTAFLKSTGPLGAAVLAGWWALRKDREKNELAAAYQQQMKAMFDQVVGLASTQAAATVKMEGTIGALKDAIVALRDHEG